MARILNIFSRKRKRKIEELPDGEFALPGSMESADEHGFARNTGYYSSLRVSSSARKRSGVSGPDGGFQNEGNFQRNGSMRRSLQNHKMILFMANLFTSENRKLRKEKEFMARRVEFLEEQMKSDKRTQQNVDGSSVETQRLIDDKLQLERKLKYSEECRVKIEQSLVKECQRSAAFDNTIKKTFDLLKTNGQKSDDTFQFLEDIKTLLLTNNDQFLHMLSKLDRNTQMVLDRVNMLSELPSVIPKFDQSKYDSLSDSVKATFRLLGEIVGERWPQFTTALGLSPELIEYFRCEIRDVGCSREEVVWRILGIWYKKEKGVSLTKLDIACCSIGVSIFSDKPMTREQRLILHNKYAELVEEITDALVVIPYLKRHALIMPNVVEHIVSGPTRTDRVRRLLDSLVTLGDKGLHAFVKALNDSGHEDLGKNILAEEARLLSEAIHVPYTMSPTSRVHTNNTRSVGVCADGAAGQVQRQRQYFESLTLPKKTDIPMPEVDEENIFPIGSRYFSDLKVSVKHMEAILMEMACKESLHCQ